MQSNRRVIVTGATGLVGKALTQELTRHGYSVVVFTRSPEQAKRTLPEAAEYVAWQPGGGGDWAKHIDGAHAIVNLAGANIFGKRWSESYKQEIMDSRVQGTRGLVDAIRRAQTKPQVLVNGSAVGYYGMTDSRKLDESAPAGDDFLAQVVQAWEREASKAEEYGVRTVMIRTGIVMDKKEGALPLMSLPFKMFVGGPVLPGTQYFSWVHVEDLTGMILMAVENSQAKGPINGSAPEPQTNKEFSKALGKVLGRPSFMPVPGFALKLALGGIADIITGGQRVIPAKAQSLGYIFKFPTSEAALKDIFKG
ncbi:MAG: TIGR01777 family oxidoreductase [Chloroflexota bacterium]|nr:TIGR01777 family oxidoreductase [Chloroflexota bacterium]